jgi:hypothetical protein
MASVGLWSGLTPEGKSFLVDDDGTASEVSDGSCSIAASVAGFCPLCRPKKRRILPCKGGRRRLVSDRQIVLLFRAGFAVGGVQGPHAKIGPGFSRQIQLLILARLLL